MPLLLDLPQTVGDTAVVLDPLAAVAEVVEFDHLGLIGIDQALYLPLLRGELAPDALSLLFLARVAGGLPRSPERASRSVRRAVPDMRPDQLLRACPP